MDNVTSDPGVQFRGYYSYLGHHAVEHSVFTLLLAFDPNWLPELYLPEHTGDLAQSVVCNADRCPGPSPGRRFHVQTQASAELPPNDEHQPPPLRRKQAALE
jgi:hypothetical protein